MMDINNIIALVLAMLVGVTLGLVGSGGSVLTVPILVYIVGLNPVLATAYSLFIIGSTALIGGIKKAKKKLVNFKMALVFGIPAVFWIFITRKFIIPAIPELLFSINNFQVTKPLFLMVLFAVVMILASFNMIKPQAKTFTSEKNKQSISYLLLLLIGSSIGILAGLVGAGGGFLIIPSLVFLARIPMKTAVGSSLVIIALQSLVGFLSDTAIIANWSFLLLFTLFSIFGIFIGDYLSNKIDGNKLKTGFGWFILIVGILIVFKELIF